METPTRNGVRWAWALCVLLFASVPVVAQEESLPDVSSIYEDLELQRDLRFRSEQGDGADSRDGASDGSGSEPTKGAGTGPERRSVDYDDLGRGGTRRAQGGGGTGAGAANLLGSVLQLLGWAVLGAAVLAVLYWIWKLVREARLPSRSAPEPHATGRAAAASPREPRTSAVPVDECRAAAVAAVEGGDPVRAVHILLLGALQVVTGRTHLQLDDAHTSRELLRGVDEGAAGRTELERLVILTEQGLFAGRPLSSEEVERGFAAYDGLRGRRS